MVVVMDSCPNTFWKMTVGIPAKSMPPGVWIELLIAQGGSFGSPMEDLVNVAVG